MLGMAAIQRMTESDMQSCLTSISCSLLLRSDMFVNKNKFKPNSEGQHNVEFKGVTTWNFELKVSLHQVIFGVSVIIKVTRFRNSITHTLILINMCLRWSITAKKVLYTVVVTAHGLVKYRVCRPQPPILNRQSSCKEKSRF